MYCIFVGGVGSTHEYFAPVTHALRHATSGHSCTHCAFVDLHHTHENATVHQLRNMLRVAASTGRRVLVCGYSAAALLLLRRAGELFEGCAGPCTMVLIDVPDPMYAQKQMDALQQRHALPLRLIRWAGKLLPGAAAAALAWAWAWLCDRQCPPMVNQQLLQAAASECLLPLIKRCAATRLDRSALSVPCHIITSTDSPYYSFNKRLGLHHMPRAKLHTLTLADGDHHFVYYRPRELAHALAAL